MLKAHLIDSLLFDLVCDPVLGDEGKLYVPEELVPIYRDCVTPVADIITPNQTELEWVTYMIFIHRNISLVIWPICSRLLSGVKVNNLQDAVTGIEILHKNGCKVIVVTSMEFSTEPNQLFVLTSRKSIIFFERNRPLLLNTYTTKLMNHHESRSAIINNNGFQFSIGNTGERALIQLPKLPAKFYGTGDLFAALFLTWITKTQDNIYVALENTVASVTSVIKKTLASFKGIIDSHCSSILLKHYSH